MYIHNILRVCVCVWEGDAVKVHQCCVFVVVVSALLDVQCQGSHLSLFGDIIMVIEGIVGNIGNVGQVGNVRSSW